MIVLRPAVDASSVTTLWLCPNRALSRRGLRGLVGLLAALTLTVAALGAWQGNVLAPAFALIESAGVAFALRTAWRAGDRGECITLDAQLLEVRALPGSRRMRFQPNWVRARLEAGRSCQRLLLTSHGRATEIGAFLGEPERIAVHARLQAMLTQIRVMPVQDPRQQS